MRPKRRLLTFVTLFDLAGAIACEVRLELLLRLADGAVSVENLAALCRHTHSYVSRQLGDLSVAGLVMYSQDGRHTLYRLSKRVQISLRPDAVALTVSGDDGSDVSYAVPVAMAERMGVRLAPPASQTVVLPPVTALPRRPQATRIERGSGASF